MPGGPEGEKRKTPQIRSSTMINVGTIASSLRDFSKAAMLSK